MLFVALDDPAGVPERVRQRPADVALALALAAFLVVGGLLAVQRPGHPIAWLLIAEGFVWELGLFCAGYVSHALPAAGRRGLDPRLDLGAGRGRDPAAAAAVPGRAAAVAALAPVAWLALAAAVALLVAAAGRRGAAARRDARRARVAASSATGARARSSGGSSAWFALRRRADRASRLAGGRARRARRVRDRDELPQRAAARGAPAGDRRRAPAPPALRPRDRSSTAPCSSCCVARRLPRDGRRRCGGWTALAAAVVTGAIAAASLRPRASRLVHREPAAGSRSRPSAASASSATASRSPTGRRRRRARC